MSRNRKVGLAAKIPRGGKVSFRAPRFGRSMAASVGGLGFASFVLFSCSVSVRADEALDRCRKVQLGMTAAEAGAVLGQPVRLGLNTRKRASTRLSI